MDTTASSASFGARVKVFCENLVYTLTFKLYHPRYTPESLKITYTVIAIVVALLARPYLPDSGMPLWFMQIIVWAVTNAIIEYPVGIYFTENAKKEGLL